MERLGDEGWSVENADVTVICERPRIAPYRETMREGLAAALGVAPEAVSVKGTTTEGMGFEGRGEGIAATAVCLLSREG
jgi:2-C-methyl-D-erythritol 2,4-cyclodiphosphate synthase